MHVIPWLLLKQAIRIEGDAGRPETPVTMPNSVFRLLVEAALKAQPFDERAYMKANPDVARSVQNGKFTSGQAHFVLAGYYEDRMLAVAGFDEEYYLTRYADVKRAVQTGECASGQAHFAGAGVREWRSPRKDAEQDMPRWHGAVTRGAAALAKPPAAPDIAVQAAETQAARASTNGKATVSA